VQNHNFSVFGLNYTLECHANSVSFKWLDGTLQYVKSVNGNQIIWAVVGDEDITCVKKY